MDVDARINAVRRFNRFYTRRIGVLQQGLSGSPFPLTEARVLYELAHRDAPTAAELRRALDIDPGYLSRILKAFERRGLLRRRKSKADGRQSHLELTPQGRKAFAPLNARSHQEVGGILSDLSSVEQERLVAAMATIETLLGERADAKLPYLLRTHGPGDMGWVVQSHG